MGQGWRSSTGQSGAAQCRSGEGRKDGQRVRTGSVVGGVVNKNPVDTFGVLVEVTHFLDPTCSHVQWYSHTQILGAGVQLVAHAVQVPAIQQQRTKQDSALLAASLYCAFGMSIAPE